MPKVEDILMKKGPDVIVLSPETTVHEAAKMMCEANVGSVIIKVDGKIEGIFTERDLLRKVVTPGKNPAETTLEDVMSSPVLTTSLHTDAATLPAIFREKHIRHLAVTEEDALVGMISGRDLLALCLTEDDEAE